MSWAENTEVLALLKRPNTSSKMGAEDSTDYISPLLAQKQNLPSIEVKLFSLKIIVPH